MTDLAKRRALIATRSNRLGDSHPDTVAARRDYYAEKIALRVEELVAQAPPLTDEQIGRITTALTRRAS